MIDLNSITILEEKLGDFGNIQLKGGVVITHTVGISNGYYDKAENDAKLKIKKELWKKIYGDLAEPINELKNLVKEYLLEPTEKGYSYHPYFLNSARTQELIDKIDNLLKMPE